MRIEIGTPVTRLSTGKAIWNVTRIEIIAGTIHIFVCPNAKYEKFKDNPDKKKLYHHDTLWIQSDINQTY